MKLSGLLHAPAALPQRERHGSRWMEGSLGSGEGSKRCGAEKILLPLLQIGVVFLDHSLYRLNYSGIFNLV
jgi:hypothetical protein